MTVPVWICLFAAFKGWFASITSTELNLHVNYISKFGFWRLHAALDEEIKLILNAI
jgi:hypothetical protein